MTWLNTSDLEFKAEDFEREGKSDGAAKLRTQLACYHSLQAAYAAAQPVYADAEELIKALDHNGGRSIVSGHYGIAEKMAEAVTNGCDQKVIDNMHADNQRFLVQYESARLAIPHQLAALATVHDCLLEACTAVEQQTTPLSGELSSNQACAFLLLQDIRVRWEKLQALHPQDLSERWAAGRLQNVFAEIHEALKEGHWAIQLRQCLDRKPNTAKPIAPTLRFYKLYVVPLAHEEMPLSSRLVPLCSSLAPLVVELESALRNFKEDRGRIDIHKLAGNLMGARNDLPALKKATEQHDRALCAYDHRLNALRLLTRRCSRLCASILNVLAPTAEESERCRLGDTMRQSALNNCVYAEWLLSRCATVVCDVLDYTIIADEECRTLALYTSSRRYHERRNLLRSGTLKPLAEKAQTLAAQTN